MARQKQEPERRRFSIGSLFQAASSAIENLGRAPQGIPARIWQETQPWVLNFSASVTAKWLPILLQAIPCGVPRADALPCTNHAATMCSACRRPCCVHHCFSDQHGDVICYACAIEVIQLKTGVKPGAGAPPPPPPGDSDDRQAPVPPDLRVVRVKNALHVLGLEDGADWKAIKAKWKGLLKKHHPDRFTNPSDKERHEAIYKRVQAAYADLERFYPPPAAGKVA